MKTKKFLKALARVFTAGIIFIAVLVLNKLDEVIIRSLYRLLGFGGR